MPLNVKGRAYISAVLIHWTGRGKTQETAFQILETICSENILRLSYCPTYVNSSFEPKSLMVCFTDIPLEHSQEHCSKFGKFGIAFKKSRMIEYGANPVHYIIGTHLHRILHIKQLIDRMKNLEKDREWMQEVERFTFTARRNRVSTRPC